MPLNHNISMMFGCYPYDRIKALCRGL
jgi:hypothetical protein